MAANAWLNVLRDDRQKDLHALALQTWIGALGGDGQVWDVPGVCRLEEGEVRYGRVLAGDYWIEERMMLHADHYREAKCLGGYEALNDVVAGRGALARTVRLTTLIDGGEITTYVADGLIVATPTGSTGYALAVGGPILPPELRNILLVAIAPHLSVDRAIVLAQGSKVDIVVHATHEMLLSADGQAAGTLADGDLIRVRRSEHSAWFARVQPATYFYTTLMARMAQKT